MLNAQRDRDQLTATRISPCAAPFDDPILNLLPAPVYLCNIQGAVIRYNRKAQELWDGVPMPRRPLKLFNLPDGPIADEVKLVAEVIRTGLGRRNTQLVIGCRSGQRIRIGADIEAVKDDSGKTSGAIVYLHNIEPTQRAEATQHDAAMQLVSDQKLREVLESFPTAIYMTDALGRITYYNHACIDLAGRIPQIGTDEWCVTWRLYWPDGSPMPHNTCPMAVALKESHPIHGAEAMAERPDGTRVTFLAYPAPLCDASGVMVGAVNMLVDITGRKRAEDHRKLLINELNHRVRNTLAAVQSIATQSFRADSESGAYQWFEGRLIALSKAHDVLSQENWEAASLREIVEQITAPLQAKSRERFEISGPDLRMRPRMTLSLALALHELCANAAKYGALSSDAGRVLIQWRVALKGMERYLHLYWEECGGPVVAPPKRKGFGSRFIQRGLASELGGEVSVDYKPGGVICTIRVPF